jgi:hypothetical protein
MEEPGGLRELGAAGRAAWEQAVARCLPARHPYLLPAPDRRTPHAVATDWTGLPVRVARCLGRERALALLDGRRDLQEEYVEWRTVRDPGDGRIRRVELTTELRDYWRVLAEHEPERAADLAGEFTGRAVTTRQLDGLLAGRLDAGTCFMTHPDNDLAALARLASGVGALLLDQRLELIELNPVVVGTAGAVAVDALARSAQSGP